jgi:D-ornithine 4,5-aminomutase subunit alpha
MKCEQRPDDFEARRQRLSALSDEALDARFWSLVDRIVAPLVAEARTHTSPSIERSVLLRMGFSSLDTKALVARMAEAGLLGRGAGRLVFDLARRRGVSVQEAGQELLAGRSWEELRP